MLANTFPLMCVNERFRKWRQFSFPRLLMSRVLWVPPGVLQLDDGISQDASMAGLLLALQPPHAFGWITKHIVIR